MKRKKNNNLSITTDKHTLIALATVVRVVLQSDTILFPIYLWKSVSKINLYFTFYRLSRMKNSASEAFIIRRKGIFKVITHKNKKKNFLFCLLTKTNIFMTNILYFAYLIKECLLYDCVLCYFEYNLFLQMNF